MGKRLPFLCHTDTLPSPAILCLQRLGVEEGLELRIVRRGAAPLGGGEVALRVPVVKNLAPINWTDEGMVKRIRGVAYSMKARDSVISLTLCSKIAGQRQLR